MVFIFPVLPSSSYPLYICRRHFGFPISYQKLCVYCTNKTSLAVEIRGMWYVLTNNKVSVVLKMNIVHVGMCNIME